MVIDDNRLLRDGVAATLNREAEFKAVAVPESFDETRLSAGAIQPQVILINARLGDRDGRASVERLRHTFSAARVIVGNLSPKDENLLEFIRGGASGFVLNDATIDDLIATVESVAAGNVVLPADLTSQLFAHLARQLADDPAPHAAPPERLTRREAEVLDLIADGLSNKEIARRLNVSTNTVKSHVHSVLEKLSLHSRAQIAAHAQQVRRRGESR